MKTNSSRYHKSVILAFTVVFVALAVQSAQAENPREEGRLSGLTDRLSTLSPLEQVSYLESLLKNDAADARVHFYMGNAFYALENYDSAVVHYQSAVDIEPDYSKAYVNMGIAFDAQRQASRASWAYEKAIENNPKDVLAYCHLGFNLFNRGKIAEAVSNYQTALAIDPDCAQAHYNLGLAFANAKIFKEALLEWTRVIELDPDGELGKIAAENVELIRTYLEAGE